MTADCAPEAPAEAPRDSAAQAVRAETPTNTEGDDSAAAGPAAPTAEVPSPREISAAQATPPAGNEPSDQAKQPEAGADAEVVAAAPEETGTGKKPADKTDAASKKTAPRPGSAALYRAFRSNRPLEGLVERVIKGGYEIKAAKARGFCPHSQMDVLRVADPETHVGKSYMFRITQVRRGGADVVLSRRALIEDQRKEEAKAVRATVIVGSIMQGHIAGTAPFGAFVDLGAGVMGLVHVSELAHARVTDPAAAVKVGDSVQVKVLKLDDKRGRVSLSIRQAIPDPWLKVAEKFKTGQVYPGSVQRLADFGVFVELGPGVEGLAPASELPPSRVGWREQLEVGSTRDWLVLSTDPKERRISLTAPVEGFDPGSMPALVPGASLEGRVQRIERFGVFVWLGPGRVGLIPNTATGTRPGTDLARQFPVGDPVQVDVTEVEDDGRRIRLAIKGFKPKPAQKDSERADDFSRRSKGPRTHEPRTLVQDPGTSFGTSLADKLKAALNQER